MKISLQGIGMNFGDAQILHDIQYEDDSFQSLAIIGPSGAGKSTLLRIIGGLIVPTEGKLVMDDHEVQFTEKELFQHRRGIGFVFQSRGLFPHLTAAQNIALPLIHVHGYSREEAEEITQSYLKRFSLAQDGHKRPYELSGGQCQRISIARAVAIKPRLLLLDEPTSALDPELTAGVLDMVNELKGGNFSIILVTHEMGFARHACDRVMFLANGRVVEAGSSDALFSRPQTSELQGFLHKVLEWGIEPDA